MSDSTNTQSPANDEPSKDTPGRYDAGQDFGYLAQRAAEQHLSDIWAVESLLEEADAGGDVELEDLPESPASAPWDGCDTCVVREVLVAAWPILEASVIARLREAGHDAAADLLIAEAEAAEAEAAEQR